MECIIDDSSNTVNVTPMDISIHSNEQEPFNTQGQTLAPRHTLQRDRHPQEELEDYMRYPFSKALTYQRLSYSHVTFIIVLFNVNEPKNFREAYSQDV
ncbi:hypothetical protein Scep_012274 [Stephania cephalantha]|uniref:Uncharacterized protein n=1 Tax=Stephania cephalantha TaxID=152367 RepID=A0AAP0P9P8_9MAGN